MSGGELFTIGQPRKPLKPRYYGNYRYRPVKGAPSTVSPTQRLANPQLEGATKQQQSNLKEENVEGDTYHPGTEGATYQSDLV